MNKAYIPNTKNTVALFDVESDTGRPARIIRPVLFWEVANPDAAIDDLIINAFCVNPTNSKEVMAVNACEGLKVTFTGYGANEKMK